VSVAARANLPRRVAGVLGRPWLIWTLAAVFAGRDLFLSAVSFDRPDTGTFWSAGRLLLSRPTTLYDQSSAWLARYHLNPLPGDVTGFISPPPVAYLFAPYGLLPRSVGIELWTVTDAILLLAGLWLNDNHRLVCPCHGAEFDLHGKNLVGAGPYSTPLPPLPAFEIQVEGNAVKVWTG